MEQAIQQTGIRKGLTKLVIPIFIETLLIMMLGAVDTVMLSQYSDESVAAVGVVNQIVMFAFLIFEVINIGTSVCAVPGSRDEEQDGAGGRCVFVAEPGRGTCGQCHFALWSNYIIGMDGTSSGTAEIWYRLHGDCRCVCFLSGYFADYFCVLA